MIEKVMQIQLPSGLEARPVAVLVQVASRHDCTVYIEAEGLLWTTFSITVRCEYFRTRGKGNSNSAMGF